MRLRYLIILILVAFAGIRAGATHMSGGEIYWECIGPNTYRIQLVVYRDCAGINVDPSYTLQLTSPCGNRSLTVTTPGGVEISQLCDMELPNSTCNGGTLPGIQQYIYSGTIVLPPCNSWSIRWTNIYRNNAIANLMNPGTQEMFIEAVMNNAVAPCNDSPVFTNTAIPYVCLGYPVTFSYGSFDPEADSLSYALIGARKAGGNPIPYLAPNTGAVPIPGITLDPVTGLINFTLNTAGNWVVVVRVTQYNEAGQVIGTIMRDMQFVAYPCDNIPPDAATGLVSNLTGAAVQTGPRAVQVCESGDFCFDMQISDVNLANVLDAFSNIQQNLPGSTFTFTGTNPITATVCWTATPGTAGFFPFIVNVNDGACPIPAFQTYVYSVEVLPGITASIQEVDETCLGTNDGSLTAVITAGTAPYIYTWSNGENTATMTDVPGDYELSITDANGCVSHLLTGTIGTSALPNEADAGADGVVCMDQLPIQLSGTVTNATTGQWSGGTGTFSGSGLNMQYVPSAADIAAGSVQLTLTTTNNTGCPPASDDVIYTIPNSFADGSVSAIDATCYGTSDGSASFSPADPGFTYLWSDPAAQTTPTATGLEAGTLNVTVTDAFGCTITMPAVIGPASPVTIVEITSVDETCLNAGNGSATVNVSGGTAPYQFEWSNNQSGPTITAPSGNYSVLITDANGCAPAVGNITIGTAAMPNSADAGGDQVLCMDALTADLAATVTNATTGTWSGGTGTFAGNGLNVQYTPSAADIAAGNVVLTFTTTDNTGCAPASDDVLLLIPNSFQDGVLLVTDATCYELSNGSASYTVGDPIFQYHWSDPLGQTTATATGLAAGGYTLTVTDIHGCSMVLPFTIGPVDPVTITEVIIVDETCLNEGNGSATVSVAGGTAPYQYNWSTGATGTSITAASGTYTISITDANGCAPAEAQATIGAAALPISVDAGADIVVCMDQLQVQLTGNIINAPGGTWSGGTGIFTGNGPSAQYTPSAADIDLGSVILTLLSDTDTGCPPDSDQVTLFIPNSFQGGSVTTTDATCSYSTDGSAAYTPAIPGFTYQWDVFNNTTPMVTGLGQGTYSVTVTDQFGCTITLPAEIELPDPLFIVETVTDPETCLGTGDGSASVVALGGTAPYTYIWSNGVVNDTIVATSGEYNVSVFDANGCVPATAQVTIAAAALPNSADAGGDQIACMDDLILDLQGSVTNAPDGTWSGGTGYFTGTGPVAQYVISPADVAAGTVTLTLTTIGNTGCPPASDQLVISIPNSFADGIITATDATCYELNNGSASYTPENATFTYLWNDPLAQNTATATGLGAGSYQLSVTDMYGCATQLPVFIGPASPITILQLISNNENCLGSGDGSASVLATGGHAPYTYSWSNGSDQSSITAASGTYTVAISDANGCAPTIGEVTIGSIGLPNIADAGADAIACMNSYPIQLQGNVTNAPSGTWSGGSGAFNDNGVSVEYFPTITEILAGGVDLVLTTSGNETCPAATDTVHITLANAFIDASILADNANCNASADGTLSFTPVNSAFTYAWDIAGAPDAPVATGLAAGDYTLTVTDQLGCDSTFSATISEPDPLVISSIITTDVSCHAGSNGQADLQIEGGTAPYLASWSNGGIGLTQFNLAAGVHEVQVIDQNGCVTSSAAIIDQPDPILVQAQVPDTVCVNAPVILTAEAQGGNGGYQFDWGTLGTGNPLTVEFPGSQVVFLSVTDSAGCSAPALTEMVYVLDLSLADLNVYGNTTVCPGEEVTIGASVSGYPGTYALSWPSLQAYGTGPFTFPISSGTNVPVILSNSCGDTQNETITLLVDVLPAVQLPPIIAQGCAPLTVQFPNIPLGNVTWAWDLGNGQTSSVPSPLVIYNAGTYTASVTVTTPFGCTTTIPASGQIIADVPPVAAFTPSAYTAALDQATFQFTDLSTGNINSYNWTFGDGGTSSAINPTHNYNDIGTFEVELMVQSANGCTSTATQILQITPVYDITLPNAFTPGQGGGNGGAFDPNDLSNDVFYAFVEHVEDFRMRIFNRWGELVFESDELTRGWDGYYKGELSPQDVYVVQTWIRFVDGREIQKLTDLTLFR